MLVAITADSRDFEHLVVQANEAWQPYAACRESAGANMNDPIGPRALDAIRKHQTILEQAVGRLLDAFPASKTQAARAAWVMSVPTHRYIVQQPTAIYAARNTRAASVAQLRKGVAVEAIETDTQAGDGAGAFVAIKLNDGSTGYALASVLKPVAPNASALAQLAKARAARSGEGDPVTALALQVRERLPRLEADLVATVTGSEQKLAQIDHVTTPDQAN